MSPGPEPVVHVAAPADHGAVVGLLRELELDYAGRDLGCFVVAETADGIVGIAEVRDVGDAHLLSCVGVREDLQGTGLGRAVVEGALRGLRKDVWLYTLVPGFFARLGFVDAPEPPPGIPPRRIYGCEACDPSRCRAMVRRADAR
jgi:N-acetylglutamate synthase-like GNAT family acetyltransferase